MEKLNKRNELGLFDNVNYVYNEHGLIDWRKMIPNEFLAPNKDKTDETDISKLSEDQLIILLGGLKYLAQLRGFLDVSYRIVSASPEYVATVCSIKWRPNFETENTCITFEATAGAHLNNVKSFARYYLVEMAENRAFARCVRNFLRINIVSDKELGEKDQGSSEEQNVIKDDRAEGISKLEKIMQKKSLVFEDIKNKLINEGVLEANQYTSIDSISTSQIYDLIKRFNTKKSKTNPIPE
jgi:uncharacterized protein YfkK (UPF0435 family)